MRRRNKLLVLLVVLYAVAGAYYFLRPDTPATPEPKTETAQETEQQNTLEPPSFDKKKYSLTDPTSIWVAVNKQYGLQPQNYKAADLVIPNVAIRSNAASDEKYVRQEVATAMESLFSEARAENINLLLASGFRSYSLQVGIYNRNVNQVGQAEADRVSAKPGHSEHQSGLSADIGAASRECEIEKCFGDMPEGKWVAQNAYKYGFIVRYPDGKESVTGYDYEPWHVRYVGIELATEMHKQQVQTLEEFFEL